MLLEQKVKLGLESRVGGETLIFMAMFFSMGGKAVSDIKDTLIKLLRDDPAFRRELIRAINMEDAVWGERLESIKKLLEEQSKLSVENTRILEAC